MAAIALRNRLRRQLDVDTTQPADGQAPVWSDADSRFNWQTLGTVDAVGDVREVGDAVMLLNSNILTSASSTFTAADAGKGIVVPDALNANYAPIVGFISGNRFGLTSHQCKIVNGSSVAITAGRPIAPTSGNPGHESFAYWGTFDTDAVQGAIDAAAAAGGSGEVRFSAGGYLVRQLTGVQRGMRLAGAGRDNTTLYLYPDTGYNILKISGGVNEAGGTAIRTDEATSGYITGFGPQTSDLTIENLGFCGAGEWNCPGGPAMSWTTQSDFYTGGGNANPTRGIWLFNIPNWDGIKLHKLRFRYFGREAIYAGIVDNFGVIHTTYNLGAGGAT